MTELENRLTKSLSELVTQHELQVSKLISLQATQTAAFEEQLSKLNGVQRAQAMQIEQLARHVSSLLKQFQE